MDGIGAKGLKTKLIVNYLPQSMSDNEFRVLFQQIGPLESYRIVRDKATNYSFGYGFVDFERPEDAETAISKLNQYKIENKTLRVAYSKPQGTSRNINLYVTGLGPHTTEQTLKELFSPYGDIVQVKVVKENTSSKEYGFVLFKEKSQADAAIRALQGYCDGYGMSLQIKYAKDPSEQQRSHKKYHEYVQSSHDGRGTVTVAYGTGYNIVPAGSMAYVENYGGGYGTIEYVANGKAVRGRGTRFNPIARPLGAGAMTMSVAGVQDGSSLVLFVYNIGPNATDSDMYNLFSKYGRITKVDVITGKGYAFVHMPIQYEANEAIKALNGTFYNGKYLQVSLKKK